jgi:hypothetical protein
MAYTNASAQFVDSPTQRFVASWFNPRPRAMVMVVNGGYTTSSASLTELGGGNARLNFITWAGAGAYLNWSMGVNIAAATDVLIVGAIDGTGVGNYGYGYVTGTTTYQSPSSGFAAELTEGFHHFEMRWQSGAAGYTMTSLVGALAGTVFI